MPYQLTEKQKLMSRRRELGEEVRGIYEKAKAEKREITGEESARVDAILVEERKVFAQVERMDKAEGLIADLEPRGEGRRSTATDPLDELNGGARGAQLDPDKGIAFRALDQDGRELRAITREGAVAAAFRDWRGPDNIRAHELSLPRMLRGLVTGQWRGAEAEQRTLVSGGAAGYTIPEPLAARLIDKARNMSVLLKAGAVTVPMPSRTLRFAKVLGDVTPAWKAEGAAASVTDLNLGAVELQSRTLMGLAATSIELAEDSLNIGEAVETSLAQTIALELDRAGLLGTGAAEEPLGLWNIAGVGEVDMGTNGAQVTGFDPFSEAVEAVLEANGVANAAIFAPRTWGAIDRLVDGDGLPLQPPPSWVALQKLVSKQVPTTQTHGSANNASSVFVGDFTQLLWGVRTDLRLETSREASDAFTKGLIYTRAYVRGDVYPARADHFCIVKGIIPS